MNYLVYTANSMHILCRTHTHTHTHNCRLTHYLLTIPLIENTTNCKLTTSCYYTDQVLSDTHWLKLSNKIAVITYSHIYIISILPLLSWPLPVFECNMCTSYNRVPVAEGTQNMKLIYSIDNLHYICVILPSPTIKLQTGDVQFTIQLNYSDIIQS